MGLLQGLWLAAEKASGSGSTHVVNWTYKVDEGPAWIHTTITHPTTEILGVEPCYGLLLAAVGLVTVVLTHMAPWVDTVA